MFQIGRPPVHHGKNWAELSRRNIDAFEGHLVDGLFYLFFVDPASGEILPVLKENKKDGQVAPKDLSTVIRNVIEKHPLANLKIVMGEFKLCMSRDDDFASEFSLLSADARAMCVQRLGLDGNTKAEQAAQFQDCVAAHKRRNPPPPPDLAMGRIVTLYQSADVGQKVAAKNLLGIDAENPIAQETALEVGRQILRGKTTTGEVIDYFRIITVLGGFQVG